MPAMLAMTLPALLANAQVQFPRSMPPSTPPGEPKPEWQPLEGFSALPIEEALAESMRRHCLLIVVCYDPPPHLQGRKPMYDNPTIRAWIKWHALAVNVRDPNICERLRAMGAKVSRGGEFEDPLIFRDGKLVHLVGSGFHGSPVSINGVSMKRTCRTAACLLLRLQLTLEAAASIDPLWHHLHEQHNPMPEPPPLPDPLYQGGDGLGEAIPDPGELDDGPPDVLARLAEARAAVKSEHLHLATGLYTWLWERAEAADPAMIGVRLTTIPAEMNGLARLRGGSRDRFERLARIQTERALWLDYSRLDEWFVLNSVVDDEGPTIAFLDTFINDLDEGSMVPREDLLAYRAIALRPAAGERISYSKPGRAAQIEQNLSRLRAAIHVPRRPSITDQEWLELRESLRRVYVSESCRAFSGFLRAGDDPRALAAARAVLAEFNEPLIRQALVASALAVGEARPFLATWLDEAEQGNNDLPGRRHPALRRQLEASLAGRELEVIESAPPAKP